MLDQSHANTVTSWQWLRVYYFERRKDDLILDGVWPALAKESAAFFKRDWRGGPNVLVGVEETPDNVSALHEGVDCIQRYLKERPSTSTLDLGKYQQQMRLWADWEAAGADSELEIQPNNSVLVGVDAPGRHAVVSRQMLETEYRFLAQSTPYVVSWLTSIRNGSDKAATAMQLLIAVLWIACPSTLRPAASLQSHSNGLMSRYASGRVETSPLYRSLENRYASERDQLLTTAREALTRLNAGEDVLPGGTVFVDLMRDTMRSIVRGFRHGRYPRTASLDSPRARASQEALDRHVELAAWQVSINLAYAMFNQLGLGVMERLWSCFSTFRIVEDLFGERLRYLSWEPARELPFLHACASEPL
jgi:Lantibiotic biosynthesis dehydratase C-term